MTIDVAERRARLALRHRLLASVRTDDLAAIADAVVALHSSDPVSVYLSAAVRMVSPSLGAVEHALYDDRSLIRHHAMRRTLWVTTPATVRVLHAAATRGLVAADRRRTAGFLAASGVSDPDAWLDDAFAQTVADLRAHGPSTAREVGARIPALRHPLQVAAGTPFAATQSAHTRVLLHLGFSGEILRARPAGTWINGAYRYAATASWLAGGLGELDPAVAAATLTDSYLRRFGPVTTADARWWTGWTVARTRQALVDCGAVAVELDGESGWVAAGDEDLVGPVEEWIAVLPGLDPTTMGWKQRGWYLPETAADAFDRNGNAGPTIWVDGRVVGAWAQHRSGELRTHWFERVAGDRRAAVAERLETLRTLIGDTRFSVRFPGRIQPTILNAHDTERPRH